MRHLKWLLAVVIVCALAARWPRPDPAMFQGEVVTGACQQHWRTSDSGNSLSIAPQFWTSIGHDPRFGEASMILQCGPTEFDRFVRGLHPFEGLFHLRKPGEREWRHPFHQIEVNGYVWVVPKKRVLSKREQALVDYISASWDPLP